jgi:hypothetical protein
VRFQVQQGRRVGEEARLGRVHRQRRAAQLGQGRELVASVRSRPGEARALAIEPEERRLVARGAGQLPHALPPDDHHAGARGGPCRGQPCLVAAARSGAVERAARERDRFRRQRN